MPTYEFRCPDGHEFEKFYRSIGSAESQAVCPQCGKPAERVMSAAGFAFKGSGFYLTDYGKNAHREKGGPAPSSQADGSAGSDAVKAESKSDAGGGSTASPASGAGESKPTPAESKKSESKAAEPKPAAPAKKSTGE
jgi:putative FmdB family regulatory protein